ncbi:hypothetical protein C0585_01810 [Candidatus Woesearchaeota archaeon]|nr:MAG: hypothetical protein C0585_01810 [Candidatus Woesearchaeota archaeon]
MSLFDDDNGIFRDGNSNDNDLLEFGVTILGSAVIAGVAGYIWATLTEEKFDEAEYGKDFDEEYEDEYDEDIDEIKGKKDIKKFFEKRIIGQKKATDVVVDRILRNQAGLRKNNRPKANLMFIGPSGVGKTEMSRAIAKFVNRYESNASGFLKIDCSEYSQEHEYAKLIGSPPGYIGSDKEGFLTGFVRKNPDAVILFDEIEKGHKSMHNLLLQIMDEGVISDNLGKKVDFTNTYIIMTSNVGLKNTDSVKQGVGFKSEKTELNSSEEKSMFMKALREYFSVEFINRVDDVVVFDRLTKKDIKTIMLKEINEYKVLLKDKDLDFEISEEVLELINERSYNVDYGAREIKRVIEKLIITPLAEFITSTENIDEESKIKLNLKNKKVCVEYA